VLPPTDAAAFARWMKRCRQPNVKCFLVCGRADGAILGALILSEIVRAVFQSAYLGYYAQQPYAGKGYMTEAIAVVKRSGFRLEGFSPRYLKVAGRWRDHQRWAMTIDDWLRLRRRARAPTARAQKRAAS